MVYGERRSETVKNQKYRNFSLGGIIVKEKAEYDHAGIKTVCMEILPLGRKIEYAADVELVML